MHLCMARDRLWFIRFFILKMESSSELPRWLKRVWGGVTSPFGTGNSGRHVQSAVMKLEQGFSCSKENISNNKWIISRGVKTIYQTNKHCDPRKAVLVLFYSRFGLLCVWLVLIWVTSAEREYTKHAVCMCVYVFNVSKKSLMMIVNFVSIYLMPESFSSD